LALGSALQSVENSLVGAFGDTVVLNGVVSSIGKAFRSAESAVSYQPSQTAKPKGWDGGTKRKEA
jgi:hypothetical protein